MVETERIERNMKEAQKKTVVQLLRCNYPAVASATAVCERQDVRQRHSSSLYPQQSPVAVCRLVAVIAGCRRDAMNSRVRARTRPSEGANVRARARGVNRKARRGNVGKY